MSSIPQQKRIVIETYNKIVNGKVENPLELLRSTIEYLKFEKSNIAEASLLYCLEVEYLINNCSYDDAYKLIMYAVQLDPQRKEVLQSLIHIHMPNMKSNSISNPYANDEKAKEYTNQLETLNSNDPNCLYIAGGIYGQLGLYNDSLRALKKAFFITVKQNNNEQIIEEIKKKITNTYVDRYSNCPNNSHEIIIKYLIELIEWKYNDFNGSNLQICIEEIWERMEFILENNTNNWSKMHKILNAQPGDPNIFSCSIPLSINILNLIYNIFKTNKQYYFGIEFFTRLITEYQTYNNNTLTLHAKFEKYYVLYLNRAKLYQMLNKINEMNEDINNCNTFNIEKVTVENLSQYIINEKNEKPVIETIKQIKKRRASIRLDNVSISPMPKQYTHFHLTPKNNCKYKRYSLNNIDRWNEKKEKEEKYDNYGQLQNKNKLLENKVVDLKNHLNQVTLENKQYKNEIEKLQKQILGNGEKQCNEFANQANQEIIESLKRQIKSLKRQNAILKDCKMKNNVAEIKMQPKKLSISICGCIGKLFKLLVSLFVFVSILVLFLTIN